jgi:hypothetical protein
MAARAETKPVSETVEIGPAAESEREWAAELMAGSDPWLRSAAARRAAKSTCSPG